MQTAFFPVVNTNAFPAPAQMASGSSSAGSPAGTSADHSFFRILQDQPSALSHDDPSNQSSEVGYFNMVSVHVPEELTVSPLGDGEEHSGLLAAQPHTWSPLGSQLENPLWERGARVSEYAAHSGLGNNDPVVQHRFIPSVAGSHTSNPLPVGVIADPHILPAGVVRLASTLAAGQTGEREVSSTLQAKPSHLLAGHPPSQANILNPTELSETSGARESGATILKFTDIPNKPIPIPGSQAPRVPLATDGLSQIPGNSVATQSGQRIQPFQVIPTDMPESEYGQLARLTPAGGTTSLSSDLPGSGKDAALISSDLPKDSGAGSYSDRTHSIVDASGKTQGVELNGGMGMNAGTGGSSHSHQNTLQMPSTHSAGSGLRTTEERPNEFPAPPLQRLQMDVQVSDTQRIQIDVGIQQRQVYAGLLMDQAGLKHLAMQHVPQLEDQLARSDMDLQEFSAEVRDHRGEQEAGANSQGAGRTFRQRNSALSHPVQETLSHAAGRAGEHGLYFVA